MKGLLNRGQVECQPPSGMLMRVQSYSLAQGGSLSLVPMQVAGSGSLSNVELRASDGEVNFLDSSTP